MQKQINLDKTQQQQQEQGQNSNKNFEKKEEEIKSEVDFYSNNDDDDDDDQIQKAIQNSLLTQKEENQKLEQSLLPQNKNYYQQQQQQQQQQMENKNYLYIQQIAQYNPYILDCIWYGEESQNAQQKDYQTWLCVCRSGQTFLDELKKIQADIIDLVQVIHRFQKPKISIFKSHQHIGILDFQKNISPQKLQSIEQKCCNYIKFYLLKQTFQEKRLYRLKMLARGDRFTYCNWKEFCQLGQENQQFSQKSQAESSFQKAKQKNMQLEHDQISSNENNEKRSSYDYGEDDCGLSEIDSEGQYQDLNLQDIENRIDSNCNQKECRKKSLQKNEVCIKEEKYETQKEEDEEIFQDQSKNDIFPEKQIFEGYHQEYQWQQKQQENLQEQNILDNSQQQQTHPSEQKILENQQEKEQQEQKNEELFQFGDLIQNELGVYIAERAIQLLFNILKEENIQHDESAKEVQQFFETYMEFQSDKNEFQLDREKLTFMLAKCIQLHSYEKELRIDLEQVAKITNTELNEHRKLIESQIQVIQEFESEKNQQSSEIQYLKQQNKFQQQQISENMELLKNQQSQNYLIQQQLLDTTKESRRQQEENQRFQSFMMEFKQVNQFKQYLDTFGINEENIQNLKENCCYQKGLQVKNNNNQKEQQQQQKSLQNQDFDFNSKSQFLQYKKIKKAKKNKNLQIVKGSQLQQQQQQQQQQQKKQSDFKTTSHKRKNPQKSSWKKKSKGGSHDNSSDKYSAGGNCKSLGDFTKIALNFDSGSGIKSKNLE